MPIMPIIIHKPGKHHTPYISVIAAMKDFIAVFRGAGSRCHHQNVRIGSPLSLDPREKGRKDIWGVWRRGRKDMA
jgi:hypothetical protein